MPRHQASTGTTVPLHPTPAPARPVERRDEARPCRQEVAEDGTQALGVIDDARGASAPMPEEWSAGASPFDGGRLRDTLRSLRRRHDELSV